MRRLGIALVLMLAARVAGAADDMAAGKKLYTAKCARCHKFYDPTAYDDSKWNEWLGKMKQKARLNDEQYAKLGSYLQSLRIESKPK
jgi:mono/diheme cytochrome c family protein